MGLPRGRLFIVVIFLCLAGIAGLFLFHDLRQADGSASPSGVRLTRIGNFTQPLEVRSYPGDRDRLYVVEQSGRIQLLVRGQKQTKPFLDIRSLVSCCGEQGLLGLAFSPQYSRNGLFYVYFTDKNGNTRVVEYARSSNKNLANPNSSRTVLFQFQPQSNHNGGQLQFGSDGYLYIGLGDGGGQGDQHGSKGNAQNLQSLLGKILRIDPRSAGGKPYSIPPDNPFVGRSQAREEIWSYGLRNPWRFSFDRLKGGLVVGDVGSSQIEEINWSAPPTRGKGSNWGWRVWEGTRKNYSSETALGAVFPATQYSHSRGRCSVTGGYVVRDSRLKSLYGKYLFADFCSGEVWQAALRSGVLAALASLLSVRVENPSSFGEDAQGRIYLSSLSGSVYRLDP